MTYTLASTALCTLAELQQQCNLDPADTSKADLLTGLINGYSARAERILGFHVISATYLERYTLRPNQKILRLNNQPLASVDFIIYGTGPAMSVGYAGAAIEARVSVTATGLRLRTINASGVATATDLAFATYPSLSLLAAAVINVSGWTATAPVNAMSNQLNPISGMACLNATANLTRPDQELQYAFDVPSGATAKEVEIVWPEVLSTAAGLSPTGAGTLNVLVQYTAGYSTVPDDIKQAFLSGAQLVYFAAGRSKPVIVSSDGEWDMTKQGELLSLFDLQFDKVKRIGVA